MTIIIISIALLSLHYFYFLTRINNGLFYLKKQQKNNFSYSVSEEFVSIIIPFRNESSNILFNLESIEKQNYPKDNFEVIYVNDCSEDDSFEKILNAKKSSNVKVMSVPERYFSGAHKKRAIQFGIENSKGDIIVSTDCDCLHSANWLRSMVSLFVNKTGFVSGPVRFETGKNIFDMFQKLEFAGLILAGAGLIGLKRPVICSAANIAYKKKAYEKVNGFDSNLNLSSGDDELLMQKIAKETDYEIKFNMDKNSVVKTIPNESIKQFYQQRKRWASKGLFYNDKLLILKLIAIFLFYASLPIQLIMGIFYSGIFFIVFVISLFLKMFFEYLILANGADFLFEKKLLFYLLPAEIFQIPYIIIAGIAGTIGNYTWKDRSLRR